MTNSILLKHTAAVQSSAPLSLVQRKSINVLLKNAMIDKTVLEDVYHEINIYDLMEAIGYSSNNRSYNEDLKKSIFQLSEINIKWNIFNKDRRGKISGQAPYLSSIVLESGIIRYTFSKEIRDSFFRPHLYAKLDLNYQKNFRFKSSMPIWEFLCEALSTQKQNSIHTNWIEYASFLKLLGIDEGYYINNYALFKNKLLKPSIDEINQKSDITVQLEEKRQHRKIDSVRFVVHKKNSEDMMTTVEELFMTQYNLLDDIDPNEQDKEITLRLENFFSKKAACELKNKYDHQRLLDTLDYCEQELKSPDSKIKNPVAFFKKALEEGWVSSDVIHERMQDQASVEALSIEDQIRTSDEPETIQSIRLFILDEIDKAPYRNWIQDIRFVWASPSLKILSETQFKSNFVENNYRDVIRRAASACLKQQELQLDFLVDKNVSHHLMA